MTVEASIGLGSPAGPGASTRSALRSLSLLSRANLTLIGLLLPAVFATVVCLIIPIAMFLIRDVSNTEITTVLPRTLVALSHWDGQGTPPDDAYSNLLKELAQAGESGRLGELARRLNILVPGYRTLVMKTGTQANDVSGPARAALIDIDRRWGEPNVWLLLRQESGRWTDSYFLAAFDLKRSLDGGIARVEERSRIFVDLFVRTFVISFSVTLLCLLFGYPAAYALAHAPKHWLGVLLVLVLLPFWTSTLVRSTAWIVLLQNEGLINKTLRASGLIDESLPLFANRFAVLVAMTHVLLPYMIMPLYGAMKAVPPDLVRAAGSLGANPIRAFRRVYLPQTYAGMAAGSLLVFILALGYYITPAIVGGPGDQMISYFIALFTNESLNWGLASALGTLLLLVTVLFYGGFSWMSRKSGSAV